MSQLFKSKDNKFTIVAYTYSTQHNWGHKATLYSNTHELNTYKITYYNRTWETYQYQSVIKAVLSDYMEYLLNNYVDDYKADNNIKRLKSSIKQELIKQCKETNTLYQELETFYKEL